MSVALVRVDDRLIHGQVVVGWGNAMRLESIVLVDDAISGSEWEQELYRAGVPPGVTVSFQSVDQAAQSYEDWAGDGQRTLVLVGDVTTLIRLCDAVPIAKVNLGGIHRAEGRQQRLPYIFLSDEELERLRALADQGVEITAQDVPTARPVTLRELS